MGYECRGCELWREDEALCFTCFWMRHAAIAPSRSDVGLKGLLPFPWKEIRLYRLSIDGATPNLFLVDARHNTWPSCMLYLLPSSFVTALNFGRALKQYPSPNPPNTLTNHPGPCAARQGALIESCCLYWQEFFQLLEKPNLVWLARVQFAGDDQGPGGGAAQVNVAVRVLAVCWSGADTKST